MKYRVLAWLLGVVSLALVLVVLAVTGRFVVSSDLLALLPVAQQDPLQSAALARMSEQGQRRVVVLIGDDDAAGRVGARDALVRSLADSGAFRSVAARADDLLDASDQRAVQQLYFRHRFHLLAPADARAIARLASDPSSHADARAQFLNRARSALYGLGVTSGGRFIDDPLRLGAAYRQSANVSPAPNLRLSGDGHFSVTGAAGQTYAVVFAQTRADPFSLTVQQQVTTALAAARRAAHQVAPSATVTVSGVVQHAAAASNRARFEVSVIGLGSLAGIVLLMLWAFGSVRPFLLSLAAVSGGVLLATVSTALVFGQVNLITLVFGASLVGVSIDYCLHFFAQRLSVPDPRRALAHVRGAIGLGLVTSVLAYAGMAVAPFPALRQIAMFTATGLIGAWLGAVLLLPGLAGAPPRAGRALALARRWQLRGPARVAAGARRAPAIAAMAGLTILLAGLAFTQLSPDDNIRVLYNPPPALLKSDNKVAGLLGTRLSSRALIVRGDSPADVLARESALVKALTMNSGPRQNSAGKPIAVLQAITQSYPPVAEQQRNYQALAHTLYAAGGPVAHLLAAAGYDAAHIAAAEQAFRDARGRTLSVTDWLASPASAGRGALWLGQIDHQWALLIRVQQINDASAFKQVLHRFDDVTDINRVAQISQLMGHYRRVATGLLGLEYGLAWLVLSVAFGARGAFSLLLAPMLASVTVAALFALTGWTFSLFNLVGLILLLGLGADYGIFLRMARGEQAPAMLAVGLSMATTLLAFGLLALSHTPALHGFGLTLGLGLLLTFLLASILGSAPTLPCPTDEAREP